VTALELGLLSQHSDQPIGVRILTWATNSSPLHRHQTGSNVHTASYSTDKGRSFSGVKAAGAHSYSSNTDILPCRTSITSTFHFTSPHIISNQHLPEGRAGAAQKSLQPTISTYLFHNKCKWSASHKSPLSCH
jgi:hypothetical protein